MTDHPLGADLDTPSDDLIVGNGANTSIINSVLNLDEFLAADIRLAQKQAAWYTRPDLEAVIEELNAELEGLTDTEGRPLTDAEATMEDSRTAQTVAAELVGVQKEYAASRRYILMQQLDQDEWTEFQATWKKVLDEDPPYPPDFYADLISRCAVKPKIRREQVDDLRKRMGAAAFDVVWSAAWAVNTRSGVSIPKSYLSSVVRRQQPPA